MKWNKFSRTPILKTLGKTARAVLHFHKRSAPPIDIDTNYRPLSIFLGFFPEFTVIVAIQNFWAACGQEYPEGYFWKIPASQLILRIY